MDSLRRKFRLTSLLVALSIFSAKAVTFEEKKANVYDIAPKLRVMGTDFTSIDASKLELSFTPKLKESKDYTMEVQSSTMIVLTRKEGKKWMTFESGQGPAALYLSGAKLDGESILDDSVQMATIVPAPSVEASDKEIYMKTTPKIVVNGTNFNTKKTDLYFDPPLQEYEKFSKKVTSPTQIVLQKVYNFVEDVSWTEEPGPLRIKAIDTGAGRLALAPEDGGVTIAEVQTDNDLHSISVRSHEELNIYQSTSELKIQGEGFLEGIKVRFNNALRGGGTNFTVSSVLPTEMTLTLAEGSTWRKNPKNLPGALVILAADAGAGWVPLGPTSFKAGRKIASVFEDPSIDSSDQEIRRTHSHELIISGTGFNRKAIPKLDFSPHFDSSKIFTEVLNRTHIKTTLSSATNAWVPEDKLGPLKIKGMDTGAGMVTFAEPVTVANVVADSEVHESGVQVFPGFNGRYQSETKPLYISGAGFKGDPKLNFEPAIWAPSNYSVEVESDSMLKLTLAKGSKWAAMTGALIVKGINVGDGEIPLANGDGVRVAIILQDPTVYPADNRIYATHTKHFPVKGAGFVNVQDPANRPIVTLAGLLPSAYIVQDNWRDGILNLQLLEGAWADVIPGEDAHVTVTVINTGAGDVTLPDGGVPVASVKLDSATAVCEDSCAFAEDGMCDEPRSTSSFFGSMYSNGYNSMSYSGTGLGWGYDDDANNLMDNDYSAMNRYAGYDTTYLYYGSNYEPSYGGAAACEIGTDCTDCNVRYTDEGTCKNTCLHARDGVCDDPRTHGACFEGTDCQDCGPWGEEYSNFTLTSFYDSFSSYMNSDWELSINDDYIMYGQENNNVGPYSRNWVDHTTTHKEAAGAGTIFMDVLWAIVVLVGVAMSLGICLIAYRHFKGGSSGPSMYLPVEHADEVELSRRGAGTETTPDVVRIG